MSTQVVADHHLAAFLAGDVDEVMKDYSGKSVFISPNGIAHGLDEIRAVFDRLLSGPFAPGSYEFHEDMRHVEGDVAYLLWHTTGTTMDFTLGTDTLVIRDGVILTQTVAIKAEPKT